METARLFRAVTAPPTPTLAGALDEESLVRWLQQRGGVAAEDLARARKRRHIYRGTLDTALLELELCREATLLKALEAASGLPTAEPAWLLETGRGAARFIDGNRARRLRAQPVAEHRGRLEIVVAHDADLDEVADWAELEHEAGCRFHLAAEVHFEGLVARVHDRALPPRFLKLLARLGAAAPAHPAHGQGLGLGRWEGRVGPMARRPRQVPPPRVETGPVLFEPPPPAPHELPAASDLAELAELAELVEATSTAALAQNEAASEPAPEPVGEPEPELLGQAVAAAVSDAVEALKATPVGLEAVTDVVLPAEGRRPGEAVELAALVQARREDPEASRIPTRPGGLDAISSAETAKYETLAGLGLDPTEVLPDAALPQPRALLPTGEFVQIDFEPEHDEQAPGPGEPQLPPPLGALPPRATLLGMPGSWAHGPEHDEVTAVGPLVMPLPAEAKAPPQVQPPEEKTPRLIELWPPREQLSPALTALRTQALAGGQDAASAIAALADQRDTTFIPELIPLLEAKDPGVAEAALAALRTLSAQDIGPSRWRWVFWWRLWGKKHRVEWLLEALSAQDPERRLHAAHELERISGLYVGYHFDLGRQEREAARRRWQRWWQEVGRHQVGR